MQIHRCLMVLVTKSGNLDFSPELRQPPLEQPQTWMGPSHQTPSAHPTHTRLFRSEKRIHAAPALKIKSSCSSSQPDLLGADDKSDGLLGNNLECCCCIFLTRINHNSCVNTPPSAGNGERGEAWGFLR